MMKGRKNLRRIGKRRKRQNGSKFRRLREEGEQMKKEENDYTNYDMGKMRGKYNYSAMILYLAVDIVEL
eukprot:1203635-Ditylum_brightwellii.AAC.1